MTKLNHEDVRPLLGEIAELGEEIKGLEAYRQGLREKVHTALTAAGVEKERVDDWTLTIVTPKPSERFTRASLIKAGALPDLLEKAVQVTKKKPYLVIRPAGAEDEDA